MDLTVSFTGIHFEASASPLMHHILLLTSQYFRVKKDEPKWLETALYIDHSVIKFHGNDTVQAYILTLINIGNMMRN